MYLYMHFVHLAGECTVKTSVTNNSLSKDYLHPDDHNKPISVLYDIHSSDDMAHSESAGQLQCIVTVLMIFFI